MKTFFKMLLATIVGTFLSLVLVLFFFLIVGIAALSKDNVPIIKPKSVLKLELNVPIEERVQDNPFEKYSSAFSTGNALGLNTLLENIVKAKEDKNIEGIYLDMSTVSAPLAALEELRNALEDFKTSGKFVYCYAESLSQSSYYLASAATKIYLNPQGLLELRGLVAQSLFFKGLFDKLGIEMQVVRYGTFKSGVEPFTLNKMSEANRLQLETVFGSMWKQVVSNISKSRSIDAQLINDVCDSLSLFDNTDLAMKLGFVDSLIYKDQFENIVHRQLGLDSAATINWVSLKEYKKIPAVERISKDKIAVVYAVGNIVDGKNGTNQVGATTAEELAKARKDEDVKAIVFRINSGGGSALASDVIWREVFLAQKEKPVVVSMGYMAASGGYYIACAADYIVAQPTTITGSIGVFGMFPNMQKMLENKLGITADKIITNAFSDFGNTTRPLSTYEIARLQKLVNETYFTFMQRVADGRNLSTSFVDSIGQGRVWSGVDAMNIGLVDTLGGLDVAIAKAAQLAKIEKYSAVEYPKMKNFYEEFMGSLLDAKIANRMQKSPLCETYLYFQYVESALELKGVQARLPYVISVE
ncbi:MAG: signal peptide peptidase SppA [Lentimicrobiaceae bacterium]|nr:signal peptide peptidase SppA [Lentimicrobiaceae bacterium]